MRATKSASIFSESGHRGLFARANVLEEFLVLLALPGMRWHRNGVLALPALIHGHTAVDEGLVTLVAQHHGLVDLPLSIRGVWSTVTAITTRLITRMVVIRMGRARSAQRDRW